MDIKITGVSADLLRQALAQAREARLAILASMSESISEPRTELSPYAPQVVTVKIDSDQIGLIIGSAVALVTGVVLHFMAEPHLYDAANIYNAHLDRHTTRSLTAPRTGVAPPNTPVGSVEVLQNDRRPSITLV